MQETMRPAVYEAEQPTGFNLFDAMLGVLVDPGGTMRIIAREQPWLWSLLLLAGITAVTWVARLTPDIAGMRDGVVPYAMQDTVRTAQAFLRSPVSIAVVSLLVMPLVMAVGCSITFGIGLLFGAEANYKGLLSTQCFAMVPSLLEALLLGAVLTVGADDPATLSSISSVFGLWGFILAVVGVRESFRVSSLTAFVITVAPFFLLSMALLGVVIALLGAAVPDPSPGFAPSGRSL